MERLETQEGAEQWTRCPECAERPVQVELVSPQEAKAARARPDPICPGCGEPSERILVLLSFDPHAKATT